MTRVPRTRSRLEELRARKKRADDETIFQASPGTRLLAGGMCALIAVMLLIHQTQIDGPKPLVRAVVAVVALALAVAGWYFFRRGARRGAAVRLDKRGLGMALGFDGWIELPWNRVEAFRYWEPTGLGRLIKRRQSRWIGILLKEDLNRGALSWDQRFELDFNAFHNRPGLCLLEPFVRAEILDVLQAFKDHAPGELDDYDWMNR